MNIDNFRVLCVNIIYLIGIFGHFLSGMVLKGVCNTLKYTIWKILEQV